MKKGQSALEYLVVYGWAILAIVLIAAILWYFGVFDFKSAEEHDALNETVEEANAFISREKIGYDDDALDSNRANEITVGRKRTELHSIRRRAFLRLGGIPHKIWG